MIKIYKTILTIISVRVLNICLSYKGTNVDLWCNFGFWGLVALHVEVRLFQHTIQHGKARSWEGCGGGEEVKKERFHYSSSFLDLWGELILSMYLILSSALGSGVYSASNRNEYQKQKKKCFWGVEHCQCWQPYRHLWDNCLGNVGSLTSHNPIGLHGLLQGQLYINFFCSPS
jgi:hypothetical protein